MYCSIDENLIPSHSNSLKYQLLRYPFPHPDYETNHTHYKSPTFSFYYFHICVYKIFCITILIIGLHHKSNNLHSTYLFRKLPNLTCIRTLIAVFHRFIIRKSTALPAAVTSHFHEPHELCTCVIPVYSISALTLVSFTPLPARIVISFHIDLKMLKLFSAIPYIYCSTACEDTICAKHNKHLRCTVLIIYAVKGAVKHSFPATLMNELYHFLRALLSSIFPLSEIQTQYRLLHALKEFCIHKHSVVFFIRIAKSTAPRPNHCHYRYIAVLLCIY